MTGFEPWRSWKQPLCQQSHNHCLKLVNPQGYSNRPCTAKVGSATAVGDEGSYLPNCQTNLVFDLHVLCIFLHFINTTPYHLGRFEPSSHSSEDKVKTFHGVIDKQNRALLN